jgi:hypothetical protein
MDAPKGRYRVEEKDGRLVVIDTATGARASSPGPPPPRGSDPVGREPGLFDRLGRMILRLAVARWDEHGRAVIAWEWEENGKTKRWDAVLDPAQQRRLARALLAFLAFPIAVMLTILGGAGLVWPVVPIAFLSAFWAVWTIHRLRRQTGGG